MELIYSIRVSTAVQDLVLESAAHRGQSREWNVSKQKLNLIQSGKPRRVPANEAQWRVLSHSGEWRVLSHSREYSGEYQWRVLGHSGEYQQTERLKAKVEPLESQWETAES